MTREAAEARPDADLDAVTVTETGVGKFQVEVLTAGASFLADEPAELGGLGSGPNPYDLLAAALGACTTMTLRLYAERKGWPLKRATVRVLHSRPTPQGRDRFAREVTLEGALDEDQRARLLEIAAKCPVHRTLEGGSDIITVAAQPRSLELPPQGRGGAHLRDMEAACRD
ncbi:OsmC family protein [Phenylobacterium sp.]|uniref:OsmC family protein n=1 Tax=Phenylobacterium sp. TaxID=1871053 RepID=UPI002FE2AAD4